MWIVFEITEVILTLALTCLHFFKLGCLTLPSLLPRCFLVLWVLVVPTFFLITPKTFPVCWKPAELSAWYSLSLSLSLFALLLCVAFVIPLLSKGWINKHVLCAWIRLSHGIEVYIAGSTRACFVTQSRNSAEVKGSQIQLLLPGSCKCLLGWIITCVWCSFVCLLYFVKL